MTIRKIIFTLVLLCSMTLSPVAGNTTIVIAEKGGGRDLVENTLPAITLAAAMDVDYLGLQVVMTADNTMVLYGDLTLNRLTDVASVFPDRNREDGGYYVIDFTLQEIRQLRLKNSLETAALPLSFGIPAFTEVLSLIRRLETLLGHDIGIAVEIRKPWFHRDEGKDISSATLDTLALFQYTSKKNKVYLQCFDPEELQRIHRDLMPQRQLNLPLIQLVAENDGQETQQRRLDTWVPYNYDWLYTNIGLRMIASYASAIGLPRKAIADQQGSPRLAAYIDEVHRLGMQVVVLSVNSREDFPDFAPDFRALLEFYNKAGADGFSTDSFKEVTRYLKERMAMPKDPSAPPDTLSNPAISEPVSGQENSQPPDPDNLPEDSTE